MSLFPSPSGPRSRTRSPPPQITRVVSAVSDEVKAKLNALADLFQTQLSRRSGMTFVSYEEDTHTSLLYSFYFQDKSHSAHQTPDKIFRLVSQIVQPLSEDVKVFQATSMAERVFRIDLSATDLLNVRPEFFQVLRHPQVQITVVYVLAFVSIVVGSLYWL
jgi:hypothetical protein